MNDRGRTGIQWMGSASRGCGPLIPSLSEASRPLRQQIFERVRAAGLMPRVQVAKELAVSPASVTTLTSELIDMGLLGEVTAQRDIADTGRGRPTLALGHHVDRAVPDKPFEACDTSDRYRPVGGSYGAPEDRPRLRQCAVLHRTYAQRPHNSDDGRPSTGWHAEFGNIDNDGCADLFIAKGNVDQMPSNAIHDPNNLLIHRPGHGARGHCPRRPELWRLPPAHQGWPNRISSGRSSAGRRATDRRRRAPWTGRHGGQETPEGRTRRRYAPKVRWR